MAPANIEMVGQHLLGGPLHRDAEPGALLAALFIRTLPSCARVHHIVRGSGGPWMSWPYLLAAATNFGTSGVAGGGSVCSWVGSPTSATKRSNPAGSVIARVRRGARPETAARSRQQYRSNRVRRSDELRPQAKRCACMPFWDLQAVDEFNVRRSQSPRFDALASRTSWSGKPELTLAGSRPSSHQIARSAAAALESVQSRASLLECANAQWPTAE